MEGGPAGQNGPCVVVLEDDPGILRLQSRALERAGFTVIGRSSCTPAFDIVRSRQCDLLILDYRLDVGCSGIDFYRSVRNEGHDIPAILVTAFSDEDRILEALRAGIRDVIPKSGEYLEYLPTAAMRVVAEARAEREAAHLAVARESEERLRALNAELERQAVQLREQAAELAEANRTKDEFLATLAHELRNPLAPIRFALALMHDLPSDLEHPRDVIERQLAHLVRLVDDLLDVSRITRNLIQLRRERVLFQTIVRDTLESIMPMLNSGGQHLVVDDPLPHVTLDADPARLTQVFTNLLHNAIKFTPRGGTITVTCDVVEPELIVRVSDTGRGIAAEHLDRVFEVFYQVEQAPHARSGGLGIGLTLARRLTQMHGGTLDADSAGSGAGATFTVRLPIVDLAAQAAATAEQRVARDGIRRLKVLVVDDNVDAAELLALVVGDAGHDAATAHTGNEACALFETFRPDVALLDIGLPDISGYEVARRLRQRAGPELFLAAITGWGQDEDRRLARDAGFNCHLVKPADPERVERLLACRAGGSPCGICDRCSGPVNRGSDRTG